ncbi:expressed unknown protein [Seminavis robusta]|uniref:Uncharacterized protein n=1 Tax=Seminavis robusta TaxID=568900 RepID=A0A9N8E5A9_9STRA|nr:expressed unknown protein [Seminavis robusta]|eukprot:Sro514_g158180.1 n/a (450) ;mRNA; r:58404-59753
MPSESDLAVATRRSIKKLFPMGSIMSSGMDNPITLHSVNQDVFARIWSLIAETMVVQVELSRSTKEEIASLVSERNSCPVCIAAHNFMGITAIVVDQNAQKNSKNVDTKKMNDRQKQHDQAIQYAELLLSEMKAQKRMCGLQPTPTKKTPKRSSSSGSVGSGKSIGSGSDGSSKKKRKRKSRRFTHLNATAKAEIALVVMLFDHMNRVVSVIMGEEMSTAMFNVPRSLARAMEAPSAVKAMSRLMAPVFSGTFKVKHQPGVTLSLFPDEQSAGSANASLLPENIQGVVLAGLERANAVGRLVEWVTTFEKEKLIKTDIMSRHLIRFLDKKVDLPHGGVNFASPEEVVEWMEGKMKTEVTTEIMGDESGDESIYGTERSIAMVLLLSSFAPQTTYGSSHWEDLVERVGVSMARSIVIWWSLRTTFKECKGLDDKIDQSKMVALLTGLTPQ